MNKNSFFFGISILVILAFGSTSEEGQIDKITSERIENFFQNYLKDQQDLIEIRRGRYQDGIDIVKTLYEKLLDLDHHYASQSMTQEIETISNPLSYAEFNANLENIKNSIKSKKSVDLPQSLEHNPFISLGYTLISSLFGNSSTKERTETISRVSCILDMTIQLHSDLKLIYHETEVMKNSCSALLLECEKLFSQIVSTVDFDQDIKECRKNDGWEELQYKLDEYFEARINTINPHASYGKESLKDDVDIDFSINRITYFLERYEEFIIESESQYQKFRDIILRYEAQSLCTENLPKEYQALKSDIESVASKFKNAYKLSELKGSKLKTMLYGK